jgi:hypothetical protein
MASTYSDLKIELIGTGEQTGTWGTSTNNNFSVAVSEAITGSADVAFSSADVTVTLTDTNAAQTARNLRLNLTGTSGGVRNLILGTGCQIEKLYLVNNGLADVVTVKNTTGTGIAVAAGKSMFVYNNGTNVVDAITYLSSLTLGTALPVTSGGTGSTSTTFVNLTSNVTGTLPVANGGTGVTGASTGTGGVVLSASPTITGTLTGSVGSFSSTMATGALTVTGAITATGNITAFFSDERLKTKTGNIENALNKVCQIETLLYHANETAVALGYDASIPEVGVTAQSVQKVQPEVVVIAPIDDKYLTVRYEKLVPLLIEAIKELKNEIDQLKK